MTKDNEMTEDERAVAEYLANGGKITICPKYERTDPEEIGNQWGKRKAGPKK